MSFGTCRPTARSVLVPAFACGIVACTTFGSANVEPVGAADGGLDAGKSASWCALRNPSSKGCWDFDDHDPATDAIRPWVNDRRGTGMLSSAGESLPNAFLSVVDAKSATSELQQGFQVAGPSVVEFGFDLKFGGCTGITAPTGLAALDYGIFFLVLAVTPDGALAACGGNDGSGANCDSTLSSFGRQRDDWLPVRFHVGLTDQRVEVSVAGVPILLKLQPSTANTIGLELGIDSEGHPVSSQCQALYDNVWFDYTP